MTNQIKYDPQSVRARYRTQAGQSAIVAIIVLFLLLFIAAIFISIIAGNLKNTQVAANMSAAGRFAEAGINYLDKQLTDSPEGADWRPVPDCTYNVQPCAAVSQSDPDYFWLKPYDPATGEGGFTRVPFGGDVPGTGSNAAQTGGRALVRVTYQPGSVDRRTGRIDPLSRYIKLEAVGRVGQINPNDPTTYGNTEGLSQRVELLGYKAIGLNEYVRNVTNKDNKPNPVGLGAPFPTRDRGQVLSLESTYEGAIRVNAPLTFYGVNRFILNPLRNDALEIAGPITMNDVPADRRATDTGITTDATQVTVSTTGLAPVFGTGTDLQNIPIVPSTSPAFRTLGPLLANATAGQIAGYALVRDNRALESANLANDGDQALDTRNTYERLRSVGRVAPPVIDNVIGGNGLTRYRALTRDSAPLSPRFTTANPVAASVISSNRAGLFGWGQGMYINNPNDVQQSSSGALLADIGYSLRSDWLNPLAYKDKRYWNGDSRYTPPATIITLYPRYFTVESSEGRQYIRNYNGVRTGSVLRFTAVNGAGLPSRQYSNVTNMQEGYPAARDADGIPGSGDEDYYEGDFVIYAEGNIRIKGIVGGRDPDTGALFKRHLTVVSNGTIYVDGNLLRDNILGNDNNPIAARVRGTSTIALLAKDYITVNTTQFFAGTTRNNTYQSELLDNTGTAPFAQQLKADDVLTLTSGFGPIFARNAGFSIPGYLTGAANVHTPDFLVRHAATANGAITMRINTTQDNNYYDFTNPGFASAVSLNPVSFNLSAADQYTNDAFSLPGSVLYPILGGGNTIGFTNVALIEVDKDSGATYLQSRAAVVPADIRIEALMYAQEGSFFIIPGTWFNPSTEDTYELFVNRGYRAGEVPIDPSNPTRQRTNPIFPFYREPLDVRITFCGSINENLPAEIGDQGAWMEKWGWIPANYGSTGLANNTSYPSQGNAVATMHGPNSPLVELRSGTSGRTAANGIVYQFDDRAVYPYAPDFSTKSTGDLYTGGRSPLRRNPFNPTQPLPFAPRLPVAPGLLYYGQSTVR